MNNPKISISVLNSWYCFTHMPWDNFLRDSWCISVRKYGYGSFSTTVSVYLAMKASKRCKYWKVLGWDQTITLTFLCVRTVNTLIWINCEDNMFNTVWSPPLFLGADQISVPDYMVWRWGASLNRVVSWAGSRLVSRRLVLRKPAGCHWPAPGWKIFSARISWDQDSGHSRLNGGYNAGKFGGKIWQ